MKIANILIAASTLFVSAQIASAQPLCAAHDNAVLQLEKQFKEQVAG